MFPFISVAILSEQPLEFGQTLAPTGEQQGFPSQYIGDCQIPTNGKLGRIVAQFEAALMDVTLSMRGTGLSGLPRSQLFAYDGRRFVRSEGRITAENGPGSE